jgi:hypothetical protein
MEIHDAGVLAIREDDPADVTATGSPGYALVEGASVVVGSEALGSARLKPRRVENRFWSDLDTAPLPEPFPPTLSRADLAHAHLAQVWKEARGDTDRVILALPGSFRDEQLSLILGIARACGMPVVGLVDSALAASDGEPGSHVLHLDVDLHRTVLTALVRGRELVRREVRVSPHAGLVSIRDAWAAKIAETFVAATRFDPLHSAATEQALYLRLPSLQERLCREDRTAVELEWSGKNLAVEVTRDRLAGAAEAAYAGIVELLRHSKRVGEPATVLLSHRASVLPGLHDRLSGVGDIRILGLPPGAAARGALRARRWIEGSGEALPFVTRLPAEEEHTEAPSISTAAAAPATRASGARPTHVLHESSAHPITGEPLILGVGRVEGGRRIELTGTTAGISRTHCALVRVGGRVLVEDHSRHGTFLNGQRVDGKTDLSAGDRLRLGTPGIELLLISVVDGDGTATN